MLIRPLLASLCLFLPAPALAQVPMVGVFIAEARCPALQSIRRETNPGGIATEPGRQYRLLGRNADPGTHYYIEVPEAEPERRWVAIGCGTVADDTQSAAAEAPVGGALASADGRSEQAEARESGGGIGKSGRSYVLAASWHAAFCETRPRAPDCRDGGDAGGFSLHGLWPQPRSNEYCDVPAQQELVDREGPWSRLPEPEMQPATRRALDRVMPGTVGNLHRHEWIKHGTCYRTDAEAYFADSILLLDSLNESGVRELFTSHRGEHLDARRVRDAFDEAFGEEAGRRVRLDCAGDGDRVIIAELLISLQGEISPGREFGELLRAASPVNGGCRGGIVDPAGLQ